MFRGGDECFFFFSVDCKRARQLFTASVRIRLPFHHLLPCVLFCLALHRSRCIVFGTGEQCPDTTGTVRVHLRRNVGWPCVLGVLLGVPHHRLLLRRTHVLLQVLTHTTPQRLGISSIQRIQNITYFYWFTPCVRYSPVSCMLSLVLPFNFVFIE